MSVLGALPSRLAALTRLRCQVFQTSYNPTSMRTGAKYLKRRLRGPSMLEYYPEQPDIAALIRQFPDEGLRNTAEETRLQDIIDKKARGKGTPKKAKTKGESFIMVHFLVQVMWLLTRHLSLQRTRVGQRRSGRCLFVVSLLLCCIIYPSALSPRRNRFCFAGFFLFCETTRAKYFYF